MLSIFQVDTNKYMIEQNSDPNPTGLPFSTYSSQHEEADPSSLVAPSTPPSSPHNGTSPSNLSDENDADCNVGDQCSIKQLLPVASRVSPAEGLARPTPISQTEPIWSNSIPVLSFKNGQIDSAHVDGQSIDVNTIKINCSMKSVNQSLSQIQPQNSPSRSNSTSPYLFTGGPPIFSVGENDKYRTLMLRRQKR